MKLNEKRALVIRVGGTNCDQETQRAMRETGIKTDTLHLNEVIKHKNLMDYHVLVIPGGFSYGDYVRGGVIFARRIYAKLGKEFKNFVNKNRPILGICNGFQVLVEEGLLPGFSSIYSYPEASLASNIPQGYNCRWVYVKNVNKGKCIFTKKIPFGKILHMPIAHSEGRFILPKQKEEKLLNKLIDEDMVVFRYCDKNGKFADGKNPINPNGSVNDIAGICNKEGNIFGLMPHPERAFYGWQLPNFYEQKRLKYADGKLIFEGLFDYLADKF